MEDNKSDFQDILNRNIYDKSSYNMKRIYRGKKLLDAVYKVKNVEFGDKLFDTITNICKD